MGTNKNNVRPVSKQQIDVDDINNMEKHKEAWEQVFETPASQRIKQRIQEQSGSFYCNENISEYIYDDELEELQKELEDKFQDVLETLVIDTESDHNTHETAKRVAKMFLHETFSGRYKNKPKTTSFPNHQTYDQLYLTGPITLRSTCAHHFAPIKGKCWVGIFPGSNVIGLSKFNRIVDWLASRPTIQEELTVQIADEIQSETQAEGVGVVIKAEHQCLTMRGVREHENDMVTSVMRGKLRYDKELKKEFFDLLKMYD